MSANTRGALPVDDNIDIDDVQRRMAAGEECSAEEYMALVRLVRVTEGWLPPSICLSSHFLLMYTTPFLADNAGMKQVKYQT
jgi:hypothetical protein